MPSTSTKSVRRFQSWATLEFDPPVEFGRHGGKVVAVMMLDGSICPLVIHYWRPGA